MAEATIRIRVGQEEQEIESLDALVAAVRSGRLGRATEVMLPGTDEWKRADLIPEVAVHLDRDPWSAWEGDTDEAALDAFVVTQKPDVVASAPFPVDEVEDLPETAMRPVDELPIKAPPEKKSAQKQEKAAPIPEDRTHPKGPAAQPPHRPKGKVIAFPGKEPVRIDGVHALDLKSQPQAKARETRPPRYPIRWGSILMLGTLATGIMLTWVWYVNINATAHFVARPELEAAAVQPTSVAQAEAVEEVSPYETLEDELREKMMEGILDIGGEMEFEDALLIELRRVNLDVAWVRVNIGTWAGRKNDLPDDVAFRVKLRSKTEELDRDLGAVGLVLGKYIQHYGINATELDVLLESNGGTMRKVQMDSRMARKFFTHRTTLEQFLSRAFVPASE